MKHFSFLALAVVAVIVGGVAIALGVSNNRQEAQLFSSFRSITPAAETRAIIQPKGDDPEPPQRYYYIYHAWETKCEIWDGNTDPATFVGFGVGTSDDTGCQAVVQGNTGDTLTINPRITNTAIRAGGTIDMGYALDKCAADPAGSSLFCCNGAWGSQNPPVCSGDTVDGNGAIVVGRGGTQGSTADITATAQTNNSLFTSTENLYRGVRDTDNVEKLQKALSDLGYYNANVNGLFGLRTRNAVKDFQKAQGLADDGVAGAATLAAVEAQLQLKSGRVPGPSVPISRACLPANMGGQPWIEVTSPNGGEVYQSGQAIPITWRSCNIPQGTNIDVDLAKGTTYTGAWLQAQPNLNLAATPNDGQDAIIFPNNGLAGYQYVPGNDFKVKLRAFWSGGSTGITEVIDESDANFSIIAPSCVTVTPVNDYNRTLSPLAADQVVAKYKFVNTCKSSVGIDKLNFQLVASKGYRLISSLDLFASQNSVNAPTDINIGTTENFVSLITPAGQKNPTAFHFTAPYVIPAGGTAYIRMHAKTQAGVNDNLFYGERTSFIIGLDDYTITNQQNNQVYFNLNGPIFLERTIINSL